MRSQEDDEKLAALSDNLTFPGVDAVRPRSPFASQLADLASPLQRLELSAPTRLLGARKILKEGQLSKVKSGRKLNTYLFNDLLLFTELKSGSEVVYRWVSRGSLSHSLQRTDSSFRS